VRSNPATAVKGPCRVANETERLRISSSGMKERQWSRL
jgi:hypothetical protein